MKWSAGALAGLLIASACASSTADSKIEPTLRSAIDDPAHASSRLAIEDGVADVFVQSNHPESTVAAMTEVGGIASTRIGTNITGRLPLNRIRAIAARPEVVRIEPGFRDTLRP